MSKILDQEITKMQRLMNYGVAENASRPANGSIERMAKAADGKTYGIIHEGTKYYTDEKYNSGVGLNNK